jgi:hypothetical protein
MKRNEFLKRLAALPFVGRALGELEEAIQEPDGVYVGLEPRCEFCGDDGYVTLDTSVLVRRGIVTDVDGFYDPWRNGGFQATQIPCPICFPEQIEPAMEFLNVPPISKGAFLAFIQTETKRMMG